MSNQTFSFYYDPTRQGYDANTWSTVSGTPVVVANHLVLDGASIIHFADLLRGDAYFSLNIQTPAAGALDSFGFTLSNKVSMVGFTVVDDVVSVIVTNGSTTKSQVIVWNTNWSNKDIVYRIKWEAGMVTFYIDGQLKATLNDLYTLGIPTVIVPGDPMSLFADSDSTNPVLINYIEVKGIESSTLEVV